LHFLLPAACPFLSAALGCGQSFTRLTSCGTSFVDVVDGVAAGVDEGVDGGSMVCWSSFAAVRCMNGTV